MPSTISSSVACSEFTSTCCSIAGKKPARVTWIEYSPAGSDAVENRPRSLVRISSGDPPSTLSDETVTVAPICGVPAGSTTTPAIWLAPLGAALSGSASRHTRHPRPRNASLGDSMLHLPCGSAVGAGRAAGAVAGAVPETGFTVKSAVGVIVCLARLSVTATSS